MDSVPIYIGFDPREAVAWHTCVQSILDNCSQPDRLAFHAVTGEQRDGSNAFIYSRFLVPWRTGFRGHALFLDGDMIVRGDVMELWALRAAGHHGVQCVKHDYRTKYPTKYLGNANEDYPRKNWSSVVLWNCGFYPNRILTPDFVASATGSFLHRFSWLKDDQIGDLPTSWNRLVLEQEVQPGDQLLHYTIGIPAFAEYADCDSAEEWWKYHGRANTPIEG
jgi:hypothetical protein